MFLAVLGGWSKNLFLIVTAKNHLDRQGVVGFPPEGSYSAPFASKPVFVALLLTRISGIPLLRKTAGDRWGDDPAYQAYLKNTPLLIPRIF